MRIASTGKQSSPRFKISCSFLAMILMMYLGQGAVVAEQSTEQKAELVEAGELPLASIPFVQNAIPMALRVKKRCSFGDMNAILLEAMGSPLETELLLTIEPIKGGPIGDSQRHVLSSEEVMKEARDQHRFAFKDASTLKEGLYGIFVCKVKPEGSRRCNDKVPGDSLRIIHQYIEDDKETHRLEIMERHQKKLEANRAIGVSDKFYFFKPVVIQGGKIHILNELMSDGLYQKFRNHLKGLKLNAEQVSAAQGYDKTLGNLPLLQTEDRVLVTLPVYNKEGCGQE